MRDLIFYLAGLVTLPALVWLWAVVRWVLAPRWTRYECLVCGTVITGRLRRFRRFAHRLRTLSRRHREELLEWQRVNGWRENKEGA